MFNVPREDLGSQAAPTRARAAAAKDDAADAAPKLADGVFVEAKRMGVVDLSGKSIEPYPGPLEATVLQKRNLPEPKAPGAPARRRGAAPAGGAAARGAAGRRGAASPIVFAKAEVSPKLFTGVNVAAPDDGEKTFPSGSATVRDGKISKLDVNMTQTVELISRGDHARDEFYVPPGMKMVQVSGTAPPKAPPEPWDWADKLGQFELVDSQRHEVQAQRRLGQGEGRAGFEPNGRALRGRVAGRRRPHEEGRPTEVWIAFLVPEGTQLTELQFDGKRVAAVNTKVE